MSDPTSGWYVRDRGKSQGPVPAEAIAQAIRAGRVSADALVRQAGRDEWLPVGKVEPFASCLAGAGREVIHFQCTCGKQMAVSRAYAGRQAMCRACGSALTIPGAAGAPSAEVTDAGAVVSAGGERGLAAAAPPAQVAVQVPSPQAVAPPGRMELGSPMPEDEQTLWAGRSAPGYYVGRYIWGAFWVALWFIVAAKARGIQAWGVNMLPKASQAQRALGDHGVGTALTLSFVLLGVLAVWRLVRTILLHLHTYYEFTTQRIKIRSGILSQQMNQVELFRVKDLSVTQSLWGKIFQYVHVRVLSSDRIVDDVVLVALPGGFHTADQIRAAAQQVRAQTGTVMIHE